MNPPVTAAARGSGDLVAPATGSVDSERVGALPNLIVIGAQKCGTSGLHYYLSLHPEVSMSRQKELNFFIAERNWPRGLDWYRRQFDPTARVRGEASPNYTAWPQHDGVPERIAATVPAARLIYLVRDPLERIASHWVHNYAKRREKGSLAETLAHPQTSYLSRSHFDAQLERFRAHFPDRQILVIENDQLRSDRAATLRRIFEFIGVDPDFEHPQFAAVRHATARKRRSTRLGIRVQKLGRSRYGRRIPRRVWLAADLALPLAKPIPKPDVRAALAESAPEALESLAADAARLREATGLDLAHWSL